jgi:serine/threonine-protein kinase
VSRVDTMPEDFYQFISRRPYTPGDVVGNRYKLLEALEPGAMGQVFLAESLAINRKVAVKLLKPELLADPSFRMRFQTEAQAMAAIEHRNVARFFDLVVGDPTFLVMEYIPGPTLSQVLDAERKLAPARAIRIALRLCWALDAAHRAGVIHRDIKPQNIILATDPELGEEPKLLDFGLAKLVRADVDERITLTGQIVGTPSYMSPEAISRRPVDERSDVYSLGCLLYHMLSGRPPFAGEDLQVMYRHINESAEPLPNLLPEIGAELWSVVASAIEKGPAERFASMREMIKALSAVQLEPKPAARASRPESSSRPTAELATTRIQLPPSANRRMFWAALAGMVIGALAVGLALAWR